MQTKLDQLDASFKKCLLELGKVLRFEADVRRIGVQGYAGNAPTKNLKAAYDSYMSHCDEIEEQLLRSKAVIERDLRRATSQPPLGSAAPKAPQAVHPQGDTNAAGSPATAADPSQPSIADIVFPLPSAVPDPSADASAESAMEIDALLATFVDAAPPNSNPFGNFDVADPNFDLDAYMASLK